MKVPIPHTHILPPLLLLIHSLASPGLKPYVDPINLQYNGDSERVQQEFSSLSLHDQSKDIFIGLSIDGDISEVLIVGFYSSGKGFDDKKPFVNDTNSIMRERSLSDLDRSLLSGSEFDIFLSFAAADAEFADEMKLRLIERYVDIYMCT